MAHRLDFRIESDPQEFVYNLDNPYASHQSHSWGLPEDAIEEIDFANGPAARFVPVVQRTLGVPQDRDYHSDSNELRNYLFYHPEHVLPYVAANLTVYPRDVRLLYIGNNPRLLTLLATCFRDLGFIRPLGWVPDLMSPPLPELADGMAAIIEYGPKDPSFSRSLITNHDVPIFDFGLDAARLPSSKVLRVTDWPPEPALSPGRNRSMFGILRRGMSHGISIDAKLVSAGLPRGQSQPSFVRSIRVAVSAHHQDTLQHPRAQRTARGLATSACIARTAGGSPRRRCNLSLGTTCRTGRSAPLAPGDSIDFTSLASSSRYKDGSWGVVDDTGTWIDGPDAAVLLSIDSAVETDLIAYVYVTETFLGPEDVPISVNVWFENEHIAKWLSASRYSCYTSRLILPQRLFAGKPLTRLVFKIENPQLYAAVARHRGVR